jgi:TrmH family RNA methyltransferase
MQTITSPSNPRFKQALQLHTARGRKKQNRIIVFGRREIDRAIAAGVRPDQIFVVSGSPADHFDAAVVYQLPAPLFEKLSYGNRLDDAIMTAARPATGLQALELQGDAIVTVAEAIEKPGNLGGILRSADGSGVDGVIVANPLTDVYHPNSIRNSSGATFGLPIAVDSNDNVLKKLKAEGFRILVASPDAVDDFYDVDLSGKTAIVVGNEAAGVSKFWAAAADGAFKIPMLGAADSLNVSVTAAIVMYESLRQRNRSQ